MSWRAILPNMAYSNTVGRNPFYIEWLSIKKKGDYGFKNNKNGVG